jgi:hypothetical protein
MALALPNLDDRRYADLVEEARDLMVAHAPLLTNHNPSDPAVTLVELFAYFAEVLLFRLNDVTDTNRARFLKLLNGPQWRAPATHDALEDEVRRTVLTLRQTDRAVTPADFEFLALAVDARRIKRAQCIPERNLQIEDPTLRGQVQPGYVSVVIVPTVLGDLAELEGLVTEYLEPRRLLTTRVQVVGARYVPFKVRLTLRLESDALESAVRERAVDALRKYFATTGEHQGEGWPFGRNVYVSELYRLLDTLPGVDYVRRRLDGFTQEALDELTTSLSYADRLLRNDVGELVSLALEADELPDAQIDGEDIEIETTLYA